MKRLFVALIVAWSPATAQTIDPTTFPKEEPSFRDQIKAARAKESADEASGPKERWWDRGTDGRRPWNTPVKPSGGLLKP
jgi:hypothetical protein